ncbi:MAG TPA: CocE/NonD family hydrolase, partial [Rhizomicrobium sp.]|nr:CocE/NonD family hydrolase [Rhizomicrobium sp.]
MGVTVERDVMVPMRDGVRLATDVYLPEGHAPGTPVLLYRTPYNKDEMAKNFGFSEFFASHGYVVVQQDCRGCFKSEGDVDFL